MDEASTLMLKRYFKEYYFRFSNEIKGPTEIQSREFGYLPFGGGMVRHISLKDVGSLRALLVKEAPAGVYCSNSLYTDPSAEMHLKGWIRAELIFDIDADSLKLPCKKVHDIWLCKGCGRREFGLRPEVCLGCRGNRLLELSWSCPNCLEGTKKETFKLLEFLEEDFGISGDQIRVYFSGSAGYHVEVVGSTYEFLDSHGRAELADYITSQGMMPEISKSTRLAPSDPGWRGRIARYIRDLDPESELFSSPNFDSRLRELVNDFTKKDLDSFLRDMVSACAVKIDAMVTTDVHRIFRMPETLNNKTGLIKKECSKNLLSSFDPTLEAIALKDATERVDVTIDMCPKITLGGETYGPFVSETRSLPLFVAVYIIAKGAGRVAPATQVIDASRQGNNVGKGAND
ncbi:MAG TPA: DNA primase small subunit domain-containing protein [Nitrososphaerales archaeon]|nr:DNA primase small subunit domain-containing protein [Nitrososphaerales archaeon]